MTWLLLALALTWPAGRDVKAAEAAASDGLLLRALACYPDMAPAASPWALAAILTWRRQAYGSCCPCP